MSNLANLPPYCDADDLADAQNYAAVHASEFRPDVQAAILWSHLSSRSTYKESLTRKAGLKDAKWLELLKNPTAFGVNAEAAILIRQALDIIIRLTRKPSAP